MIGVDLGGLSDLFRLLLVMRNRVMRVRNPDLRIRHAALLEAHHQSDDTRKIGLVGQDFNVEHQLHVVFPRTVVDPVARGRRRVPRGQAADDIRERHPDADVEM